MIHKWLQKFTLNLFGYRADQVSIETRNTSSTGNQLEKAVLQKLVYLGFVQIPVKHAAAHTGRSLKFGNLSRAVF